MPCNLCSFFLLLSTSSLVGVVLGLIHQPLTMLLEERRKVIGAPPDAEVSNTVERKLSERRPKPSDLIRHV
jgi:hypothetical protein